MRNACIGRSFPTVTTKSATGHFGNLWTDPTMPRARARNIISVVAHRHRMTVDRLMTATERDATVARQEAMHEVRRQLRWSYPHLGALFERDHTTVMHGVRRHLERAA